MTALEEYWPLVRRIARRVHRRARRWGEDELASFGLDGLMSALRRYDPKHGWSFPRYAAYRIHGSILDGMSMRRWKLLPESDFDVRSLSCEPRTTEGLYDLLKGLAERERYVLCLYYRDGWGLKAIGSSLGLTESATCVIAKKALAKIRARLLRESSRP